MKTVDEALAEMRAARDEHNAACQALKLAEKALSDAKHRQRCAAADYENARDSLGLAVENEAQAADGAP